MSKNAHPTTVTYEIKIPVPSQMGQMGQKAVRDKDFVERTLHDSRGWKAQGINIISWPFGRTGTLNKPHVTIEFKTEQQIAKRFPGLVGFSVAHTLNHKNWYIWINQENWDDPPEDFEGSKNMYRAYVVQHEFGHALGHGHKLPNGTQCPCPVMYQQTRGTRNKCKPNPWKIMQRGDT